MKIDHSVCGEPRRFDKLNCGDSFIYMNDLYIKSKTIHAESTEYNAVRLCNGEAGYLIPEEVVKLVKTKAVRDND